MASRLLCEARRALLDRMHRKGRPVTADRTSTFDRSRGSVEHALVRRGNAGRVTVALGLAGVVAFACVTAQAASPSEEDRVLATELFHEGRDLIAAGKYEEACGKLEESQRLDPGGGTLLNLALCHELEGRTATAWAEFHEALSVARRDNRADREEEAQSHIAALEPRLGRLQIEIPREARLPGLLVRRDLGVLGPAAWGTAAPVDPGDHVVEAEAPGHATWRIWVTVAPGPDLKSVSVPLLAPLPPASPPNEAVVQGASPMPPPATTAPTATWRRPAALAFAGVGAIGVGLGVVFGLQAMNEWKSAEGGCSNGTCKDAPSYSAWGDARRDGDLSTVAFIVGGAALAGGAVLWLTTPSRSVAVGAGTQRVQLTVAF
jgi:serine/threonine-protein kinase